VADRGADREPSLGVAMQVLLLLGAVLVSIVTVLIGAQVVLSLVFRLMSKLR